MRVSTLLRRLIGVTQVFVADVAFEDRGMTVDVRPRWRQPRCGRCGRRSPGYDCRAPRLWRHLNLGQVRIWLRYAPRRVSCSRCGVVGEKVPWAEHGSRFTKDFEELVAYLARATDKTAVMKLMGISWSTVGVIVERLVGRRLHPDRLDHLRRIGVDEFSYRRRHRYITTVVDHDQRRVVWAAPGRSGDTLCSFFDLLGAERCANIEIATIDMAGGYINAITEKLPHAQITFDRFHVQRLASDAIDSVRREQLHELRGTPEGAALFRLRFALWKNPWNLTRLERVKLSALQQTNAKLYRAYLLKESLAQTLDYKQPARAERALQEWLAWASRSKLKPFIKVARTIRKHFRGVLGYVRDRLTNALAEGFNTRLRMVARRAFGFHGAPPLIAMLFLCCGGIPLDPPLPQPT